MFKNLLVPLDGSRLAETALPAAAYLAQTLPAAVTLIHVIEHNAPQAVHSEPHLTRPSDAQAYLDEVARRAFPTSVTVARHVHANEVRDVARSLADHAAELKLDLIVMCAHGRSGPRDWFFGSIAQQVIARGATPVLLIRPTETGTAPPFACRLILAPLDGNPAHEQGLQLAAGLAQACAGALHLVMVIPTLGTLSGEQAAAAKLLPQAAKAMLDLNQQQAEDYLHRHAAPLRDSGLTVTTEVARGDPVPSLMQATQRVGADLIVLGTHGKTGLDAFWSGSVAPKVSGRSTVPLLLVPLRKPSPD